MYVTLPPKGPGTPPPRNEKRETRKLSCNQKSAAHRFYFSERENLTIFKIGSPPIFCHREKYSRISVKFNNVNITAVCKLPWTLAAPTNLIILLVQTNRVLYDKSAAGYKVKDALEKGDIWQIGVDIAVNTTDLRCRFSFLVSRWRCDRSVRFLVSRFSFLVSRFSFLVSRFSFLVSRFSFLVSRFSFLVSRFSFLVSRFSFLVSRFSFLVSRFSFLVSRFSFLVSRFSFLVSRFSFLVSRFSFLVSRFSFLVSRFSFLVSRFSFLVSRFSFLVSRFSFLVSRFSFLVSRFSFLVSRFSFLGGGVTGPLD